MTTLALEYYRRTGEAERALKLPFSLLLTGGGGDRLVVTVNALRVSPVPYHRYRGKLWVRHWRLAECRSGQDLPPFEESFLRPGTPLRNGKTVLAGYRMLPYHLPEGLACPERCRGSWRRQQQEYERDVDLYLNSGTHRRRRDQWLWAAYEEAYGRPGGVNAPDGAWIRWSGRLLLDRPRAGGQPVAAEVVFSDSYPLLPLRPDDPTVA